MSNAFEPLNHTPKELTDSLGRLEWPAMQETLLLLCWTPYGRLAWESAPFFEFAAQARQHQVQVSALKLFLIKYGEPILSGEIPDAGPVLRRIEKGGYLALEEVVRLARLIRLGQQLTTHFQRRELPEPEAGVLFEMLSIIPDVARLNDYFRQFINSDNQLRDDATPRLAQLKQRRYHERQNLMQRLQGYLQQSTLSGVFQNATVTEREGRYVLPVKIEHRAKFPGLVHGSSASGSTLFVEPHETVDLNNRLLETDAEIHQEIERILQEISETLHPQHALFTEFVDRLGYLDRRLSAARLSRQLDANPVDVLEQPALNLRQARHPLLVLQARGTSKTVVPNDIYLGHDGERVLVITGPNTGGKTVVLKTIGLCAWMLRAGLHLPVAEQSSMGFLNPIFADIGDQQSIAQSLSTFSAHIQQLKRFLDPTTDLRQGLVLIDEIAAGTDPAEGAALARAVLQALYQKGGLTVVTTHLGELKIEAHQQPGYVNASVEFNPETLSPTYRLTMGLPGASNALTIAEKLGIPAEVIERAKACLSAPVREAAGLLESLETRNRQLEEALTEARSLREAAQADYRKACEERQALEDEKREILKRFQSQLKSRVHELDAQLKQLRKSMREEAENAETLAALNQELRQLDRDANEAFAQQAGQIDGDRVSMQDLQVGQTVHSKQMGLTGEIIALLTQSDEVVVQSGLMRVTLPLDDIQTRLSRKHRRKPDFRDRYVGALREQQLTSVTTANPARPIRQELDVRGMHAEEALLQVEQFLDEAVIAGLPQVGVIHGLGTGVLKREIRQFLAHSRYVKQFHPADALDGGDGKTVVVLT